MSITEQSIQTALKEVVDPNTGKDLVTSRSVKNIRITGSDVSLDVELGYPAKSQIDGIRGEVIGALKALPGIGNISANVFSKVVTHAVQKGVKLIPGVKNIIAVASGKGGVGKSTTAVNLALALSAEGANVGLLDADIYGPSLPTMLGISTGRPESIDGKGLEPMEAHGLQAMSIGFLIDPEQPMVWRGPMVTQALTQLLTETRWRDVDYLIIDMPPGTGDVALSLSQHTSVTGAVVVTTPQTVSVADSRRAIQMYRKLQVPVLGVVENMSYFACPSCQHETDLFGRGGGQRLAEDLQVPFLGAVPVAEPVRSGGDIGMPIVLASPDHVVARAIVSVAEQVAAQVSIRAFRTIPLTPVS
jgi:ATP-binding protein involved in chromosome partitioning